ncbi:hypothetical protein DFH29DRAFT_985413 [Suillus ampliporus]|nr:hypothetical protein DFH29DRAFT_985413 [Suillus ampliporus]
MVRGQHFKTWNKHHAIYMSNANLTREMLERRSLLFIVDAADSGIVAWDCKDQEEVMLIFTAGLNCTNYFCRTYDVGGTKEYKASDEGYHNIFIPGNLRTPEKTTEDIRHQFEAAMKIGSAVSSTGVRDSASASILESLIELGKKLRKREPGVTSNVRSDVTAALEREFEEQLQGATLEDTINPLLGINRISIHLDTPTEILHTILLGITVFLLEKAKLLHIFQSRLESEVLLGNTSKAWPQVMPFLIHDLIPRTVVNGWTVIGELVALVWHHDDIGH